MFVCCECCVLSGRGLCDGLITRREESYRLWCVVVCVQETSNTMRLKPATGLWKIQPHWVVTPGKHTKKHTEPVNLMLFMECCKMRTDVYFPWYSFRSIPVSARSAALAFWDWWFESRRSLGRQSFVNVVFCRRCLRRADPSSRGALPRMCVSLGVTKWISSPLHLQ